MSFIGIVANRKCFEKLRREIMENLQKEEINLIQINLRSIENVKNIKFETIIVEDNLDKFRKYRDVIEKICKQTQYLMINTDRNPETKVIGKMGNKITYGLNHKALVTVSSISDTDILIYWQKNLQNKEGKRIEIEERRIKKKEKSLLKTYDILIIFALFKMYNKSIMDEI